MHDEYLVNVHFGNIPHSFIPHFTLHSAEKIRIKFSANYPLTTIRIPLQHRIPTKYPFPDDDCTEHEYATHPDIFLPFTALLSCYIALRRYD